MAKHEKKKFKKIVKWKHELGWEIIPLIIGIIVIVVPFVSSIRISLDELVKSGTAIRFYLTGVILLFIALIMWILNVDREVYYEEV